ncbi:hypothetical protein [Methylobacterium oxalidis]|uniref:Uncharacterized protein n=1 Tax=Methylobacterium oxalidis TaxID=944322 RepID=A0A512J4P4_9HYPH|nr:hypothetical protein [Methylobacterium oxalidis]GEP04924.1 hypothetical protein MOX02_29620 [Methylobacterium oxalidis]GJE34703.1 hypothetical protein LDDCCGHA_4916 [Methylobacterium oxalidis]GLS67055.1 hypothetical protein GCM10007888_54380 [Methylobacterium oxalidis]
MARRTRPSLTSLSPRPAAEPRPDAADPRPLPLSTPPSPTPEPARSAAQGPRLLQVWVNAPGFAELHRLAAERGVPVEALGVEALNDLLIKNKRPPVVEGRTARPGAAGPAAAPLPLWPGLPATWWYETFTAPMLAAWTGRKRE